WDGIQPLRLILHEVHSAPAPQAYCPRLRRNVQRFYLCAERSLVHKRVSISSAQERPRAVTAKLAGMGPARSHFDGLVLEDKCHRDDRHALASPLATGVLPAGAWPTEDRLWRSPPGRGVGEG